MTKLYSAADMATVHTAVASLEASRASNLATFIGSPPGTGGGVLAARRMLENLTSSGAPDNLTTSDVAQAHRRAVERLMAITAG